MKRSCSVSVVLLVSFGLGLMLAAKNLAQTSCSNSTGCSNTCNVPLGSSKLVAGAYTVCVDQSVTNLNNSNLQSGINNMVSSWNAVSSGNSNAPTFATGTSGCKIYVRAENISSDAEWRINSNSTGGTIVINSSSAGSWSEPLSTSNMTHELGHGMGLADAGSSDGCSVTDTVMFSPFPAGQPVARSPTSCDQNATQNQYPPPPPPCGPPPGCLNWNQPTCECFDPPTDPWPSSPIILAVGQSSDYHLVGPSDAVWFDLDGDGVRGHMGWTRANDLVGFLVLDRNHNGVIDSGREMFGNYTPLEGDQNPVNGFQALAFWDDPNAGGNGDGWIDPNDAVWASLRIWIDANHDGISQATEMIPLPALRITAISTSAYAEGRRDQYGNYFRLRGQFIINGHPRWAYDVYFIVARQ